MPLNRAGATPAEECPKCDRRFSKPGWLAEVLASVGLELATVERVAAQAFHWAAIEATNLACLYPGKPTPLEWEALKELASARNEYQNARLQRASEDKPPQQTYGKEAWQRESIAHIKRMQREGK